MFISMLNLNVRVNLLITVSKYPIITNSRVCVCIYTHTRIRKAYLERREKCLDAFASNVDVETDYRIRFCCVSRDAGKARKMILVT